ALPNVGKTMFIYTKDELLDKTKGIPTLSTAINVGIMYEGMKNNQPSNSGGTSTAVVSAVMSMLVLVVSKPDTVYGAGKEGMCVHMDNIRAAIKRTKSPTNHAWVFQMEAPVEENKDAIVWIQRWHTACNV
ncbi:MAG: hypothetical protein RR280_04375, partial [Bacteroidaceae bacterium]